MSCSVPVSIGELFDKYSILMIKEEKIKNKDQLKYVQEEKRSLENMKHTFQIPPFLFQQLKSCNEQLWEIEDTIRKHEQNKLFDATFIETARSVYFLNDKRAALKKEINVLFNSNIMEVKSYETYESNS